MKPLCLLSFIFVSYIFFDYPNILFFGISLLTVCVLLIITHILTNYEANLIEETQT